MKLVSGKARTVASNVSSLFKQQMQKELLARHPPRFELRASGFPFCALRSSYRRCLAKQGKYKTTENFGSMFYTSVGTAAHLAFQRWMGATGRMYGAWRCTCGGYKRFSNKNKCNICGKEMEYVEVTVAHGKYMTGHIDGIYRDTDGRWYVLDYKTSSVRNVEQAKKTPGKFPYYGNVCQIKAYCALAEAELGIEISGWILVYVSRDAPMFSFKAEADYISDKEKRQQIRLIEKYDRHYGYMREGLTRDTLQTLVAEKPCQSYEQYEETYMGLNPCELAPVCFSKGALNSKLQTILEYL